MVEDKRSRRVFPSAEEDAGAAQLAPLTPQVRSASYRLAYSDGDFLLRDELRPVRLQLELLKPDLLQQDYGIRSTVVVFGSTRIPDADTAASRLRNAETEAASHPLDPACLRKVEIARRIVTKTRYYEEARKLGNIVTSDSQNGERYEMVVVTGGGSGIMEAANRGAHEAGGKSIGLNIVLPREQSPNQYITPELSFQFHYFAIRKMHFLLRARALVAFPGGFGTLDEFFETLTLMQTGKIKRVPVLLFGKEYWQRIIDFDALVDEGTIDARDLDLFQYVATADEAWNVIQSFHAGEAGEE